mgnify:CR=1 FL=1
MEKFSGFTNKNIEADTVDGLEVQVEANLESNDSLLLFERLSNPNIQEQIFFKFQMISIY